MFEWLANLLQTPKIRELEEDKSELSERAEAADLAHKDAKRLYRSMKQGFDARGEELLVKQETIRITNEELEETKSTLVSLEAIMQDQGGKINQLEGEAEEGRKAFHELAAYHDSALADRDELARQLTEANGQLSAKERQIGELREGVDYWVSAYWRVRRQSDDWQALYDIKHQQLMDTVDAYREYRRGIFQLGRVGQADKVRVDRQIARLEETVKRKDSRVAYLEEELRRSLKRDPKTGRIIGGNYRGKR